MNKTIYIRGGDVALYDSCAEIAKADGSSIGTVIISLLKKYHADRMKEFCVCGEMLRDGWKFCPRCGVGQAFSCKAEVGLQ